jgi:thiamine-monophosphate kinase
MNNSEFDLIKKYFTFPVTRDDVLIAGGDDCASVSVPAGKQLLITTDTLIAGVHFPEKTSPEDIAYKAVMVNLSDLAAMGATPSWITLAISLPEVDHSWLAAFSQQLYLVLSKFNICLIGGDTTRGPLSITIQAMGLCDQDRILRRDQARPGDKIYVTGELGDAVVGLHAVLNELVDTALLPCIHRLNRPEARVSFAEQLTDYSVCAIDVSDGLIADLGHVLEASQCGARVDLSKVPLSLSVQHYFRNYHNNKIDWSMVLTQGDDYELCFTLDEKYQAAVIALADRHQLRLSCIGEITGSGELLCFDETQQAFHFSETGFQHF